MKHPGTDFHRRAEDTARGKAIWAGYQRRMANVAEWIRRGNAAMKDGNMVLAQNLYRQAVLENPAMRQH